MYLYTLSEVGNGRIRSLSVVSVYFDLLTQSTIDISKSKFIPNYNPGAVRSTSGLHPVCLQKFQLV